MFSYLITEEEYFLRYFDRHSDENVTLSQLFVNINDFGSKIVNFLKRFGTETKIARDKIIHVSNLIYFNVKFPPLTP